MEGLLHWLLEFIQLGLSYHYELPSVYTCKIKTLCNLFHFHEKQQILIFFLLTVSFIFREGARVTWGYINRILGQPSLIRESSMPKFPLPASRLLKPNSASLSGGAGFENVILHPSLKRRIEHLARATANTKSHDAPFRNMMFYGPPGTGKTLVAREMARKSVS